MGEHSFKLTKVSTKQKRNTTLDPQTVMSCLKYKYI